MKKQLLPQVGLLAILLLFLAPVQAQLQQVPSQNPFDAKKKTQVTAVPMQIDPVVISSGQYHQFSLTGAQPFAPLVRPAASAPQTPTRKMIKIRSIERDQESGLPYYIEIEGSDSPAGVSRATMTERAMDVLADISPLLRIEDGRSEFYLIKSNTDELGHQHFRFAQQLGGIPVYASDLILHFQPDGTILFTGRNQATPQGQSFQPTVLVQGAIATAKQDLATRTAIRNFTQQELDFFNYNTEVSELVWYLPDNSKSHRLTWHLTLRPNILERWEYFVDAQTGGIIEQYNHTCAVGPRTAQGTDLLGVNRTINTFQKPDNSYILLDASRPMYTGPSNQLPSQGDGYILTMDLNNTSTSNPQTSEITSGNNTWNAKSVSAHFNGGASYEYFRATHGRNSIDGKGGDVVSFINVADENGQAMDNAFWNGQFMFYGNGNSQFNKPLQAALDVGGHEMTHGVIQNTANLEYKDQSGALSESFADVFGAMIDRDDWQMGEDVSNPAVFPTGAMRDMSNPNNGGNGLGDSGWQPKHMNNFFSGQQDNGGVHINSGIVNYAYYLFATNGSVGKNKAEKVYYRTLATYLTRSSQFGDLRKSVIKSCQDLYDNTIANAAAAAFDQVGITGSAPSGGNNGSGYQVDLNANPGAELIMFQNLDTNFPPQLYTVTPDGQTFEGITNTKPKRRVTITDDGAFTLFIDQSNNIRLLDMTSGSPVESTITNDNFWDNVAISKDGSRLAAVSVNVEAKIYVYDFTIQQWAIFDLFNPTTGQGVSTGDVIYPDAVYWDHSGQFVLYDALNRITNSSGTDLEYFDIGILSAFDNQSNSYGDGAIGKLFSGLAEGETVGNPVFAKNSPYIITYDFFDANTNAMKIEAVNVETGEGGLIFDNSVLGFPDYSNQDDWIIFNALDQQSDDLIGAIQLQSNKIQPVAGTAVGFVGQAINPVWFATGTRNLSVAIDDDLNLQAFPLTAYPNPAADFVQLKAELETGTQVQVTLLDLMGRVVLEKDMGYQPTGNFEASLDLGGVPTGSYILRMQAGAALSSFRLLVE